VCETWSLILWEGHRLRLFENRVWSRIFESKREEVIGGLRKLNNEEPHNFYSSPHMRVYSKVSGLAAWSKK
jgi:hypothetical protein